MDQQAPDESSNIGHTHVDIFSSKRSDESEEWAGSFADESPTRAPEWPTAVRSWPNIRSTPYHHQLRHSDAEDEALTGHGPEHFHVQDQAPAKHSLGLSHAQEEALAGHGRVHSQGIEYDAPRSAGPPIRL
jgi:hypothetical protein